MLARNLLASFAIGALILTTGCAAEEEPAAPATSEVQKKGSTLTRPSSPKSSTRRLQTTGDGEASATTSSNALPAAKRYAYCSPHLTPSINCARPSTQRETSRAETRTGW